MDTIFTEEYSRIILYFQGKRYIANLEEIIYQKSLDGYPKYYQKELFDKLIFPKIYFKLTLIKQITNEKLSKLKVVSSGSQVLETLNRSMSFFFAEYVTGKTKHLYRSKVIKIWLNKF